MPSTFQITSFITVALISFTSWFFCLRRPQRRMGRCQLRPGWLADLCPWPSLNRRPRITCDWRPSVERIWSRCRSCNLMQFVNKSFIARSCQEASVIDVLPGTLSYCGNEAGHCAWHWSIGRLVTLCYPVWQGSSPVVLTNVKHLTTPFNFLGETQSRFALLE